MGLYSQQSSVNKIYRKAEAVPEAIAGAIADAVTTMDERIIELEIFPNEDKRQTIQTELDDDDSGYGEGGEDTEDIPHVGAEDRRSEGKMPLAFAQSTPHKQSLPLMRSGENFIDGLRSSPTATLIFGERSVELSR